MKNLTILVALLLWAMSTNAQNVVAKVNQNISGKSAAGKWIDYTVEPSSDKISFSFETKRSKKVAKFEHYEFDMGLNYKGMQEEEITLEKMKTRFRLFEGLGKPDAPLLRVRKNWASGQLIMEEGYISARTAGRAIITDFVTQKKIKPKGEDGTKLLLIHSRTETPMYYASLGKPFFGTAKAGVRATTTGGTGNIAYNEGDVLAFIYQRIKPSFQNYGFLVYDVKNVERKKEVDIKFDKACRPIYVRDMPNGDMALIFAPIMRTDLAKNKKMAAINTHDKPTYTYLRVNTQGETMDRLNFELGKNKVGQPWTLAVVPDSDPTSTNAYIVGYGNPDFLGMGGAGEVTASWAATNASSLPPATNYTAGKVSTVIMGKVQDGKLAYFNKMSPDEFFSSTVTNGLKIPKGKDAGKFFLSNLNFSCANTINGKDFLVGHTKTSGKLFVSQLSSAGKLEAVYLTQAAKQCAFKSAGLRKKSTNETSLFFTFQETESIEKDFERTMKILTINSANNSFNDPVDILPKKHFVDPVDPIKFISDSEALILGHSSRKDITLVKVKL